MEPVEVLIECPKCGAWMKLNRAPPGVDWESFYGCTQYPKCKGTRELTQLGEPISDVELKEREDIKAEIKWEKKHGKVGDDPDNQDVVSVASKEGRNHLTVSERNRRHDRLVARAHDNGRLRLTLSRIRKRRGIRRLIFEVLFERGKHGRKR